MRPLLLSLDQVDPHDLVFHQVHQVDDDPSDLVDMIVKAASLDTRSLLILYCRFYGDMTLEEIGRSLKISRERVRQIERKAIRKIRLICKSNDTIYKAMRLSLGLSSLSFAEYEKIMNDRCWNWRYGWMRESWS